MYNLMSSIYCYCNVNVLSDLSIRIFFSQQVDDDTDGYDAWMKRHQQVDNEVLHDQEYESLHEQHFSHDTLDQLSQAGRHYVYEG